MTITKRLLAFGLTILAMSGAATAAARQPAPSPTITISALDSACEGAWQEIQTLNRSLQFMPRRAMTREERTRLSCLLDAIGRTTFDARDSQFNDFLAMKATRLTASAYSPAGYDFLAEQMAGPFPQPVVRGLEEVLLASGHPEAFRRYFAEHRGEATAGVSAEKAGHNVYVLFEPLIARGTCSSGVCSDRVLETLQLIAANLDLLDRQLQAAEGFLPASSTQEAERDARYVRDSARSLRATIGRITRSEATIGAVTPR